MKLSSTIKIIDLLSFTVLTLMISTGTVIKYTLPPRSGGDEVWGLSRHDWGDIHFYISVIFLLLMVVHLIIHAKFIKSVIVGRASAEKNYRVAIGLLAVITLIFLAFAPVASPVTDVQRGQNHYQKNR